jgi:Na+/H+ antiporter NhaD/arsenite permease-like protein
MAALPMLVAFAVASLVTLWRDGRLQGSAELSRLFRAGILLIFFVGLILTWGAAQTAAGAFALYLNVHNEPAWRGAFWIAGFVSSLLFAMPIMFYYRRLFRSLRQARMYRAGITRPEASK